MTTHTEPRIYVGTYSKYNNGSIKGAWLSLEGHDAKSFFEACRDLHSDESDPELMFQDFEGFPKAFYGESYLSETLWEWIKCSEEEREIWEAYADAIGYPMEETTLEQAQDAYAGTYDSEEDFSESLCFEDLSEIPDYLKSCINWKAVWNTALRFNYVSTGTHGNMMFFQNN